MAIKRVSKEIKLPESKYEFNNQIYDALSKDEKIDSESIKSISKKFIPLERVDKHFSELDILKSNSEEDLIDCKALEKQVRNVIRQIDIAQGLQLKILNERRG